MILRMTIWGDLKLKIGNNLIVRLSTKTRPEIEVVHTHFLNEMKHKNFCVYNEELIGYSKYRFKTIKYSIEKAVHECCMDAGLQYTKINEEELDLEITYLHDYQQNYVTLFFLNNIINAFAVDNNGKSLEQLYVLENLI